MADSKKYNGSTWEHSLRKLTTATDTFTTLPVDIYADGNNATVGISGNTVQSGTPTPDNPIMPVGCGERTAQLFDISSKKTIGGKVAYDCPLTIGTEYTFTNCSEYVLGFKISNWPTAAYSVQKESLQPGESYTFTMTLNPNLPPGTTQYFFIIINSVYGAAVNDGDIMLNLGSTPLPYEPYGVKIPISSASTTTPVYLGEVETTRRVKKLVLTGEENWLEVASGLYRITLDDYLRVANAQVGISTHFGGGYTIGTAPAPKQDMLTFLVSGSGNNYMYLTPSQYLTRNDFQSYLAAQYAAGTPVTVWYILATETTDIVNEPLMKIGDYADTVSGITIPTITAKDTFDVETTLKPSEVTLSYTGWHDATVEEWDGSRWNE